MTDLNPQDRALVDLAREGSDPTDADRKHVRAALVAQLGVGVGLTSTTAVGAATATGAAVVGGAVAVGGASASLLAPKVVAAVLLAGALGGGGFALHRSMLAGAAPMASSVGLVPQATGSNAPEGAPFAAVALPPLAPVPPSTVLSARPPNAPGARPHVEPAFPPRSEAPTAPTKSPLDGTPVAAGAPSMEPVTPLAPTTLDAETQLVRAGVAALHAGDPARALGIFDEHARLYPSGFLSEERAGERVLALCDLGRVGDAADAARAFLAEHPRSPLAARIRRSCAGSTNP